MSANVIISTECVTKDEEVIKQILKRVSTIVTNSYYRAEKEKK